MFSGSLVAIVTPMRPDGAVDLEAWARLLEFHLANGTNGIVVGGTTGESATLRDAELRELTQRACAQLGGRVAVIDGAGAAGPRASGRGSLTDTDIIQAMHQAAPPSRQTSEKSTQEQR